MRELRLVSHKQSPALPDALEQTARTIEIVRICEDESDPLINELAPFVVKKERVNRWHGTWQGGRGSLKFTVSADRRVFVRLRKYEGFFRSTADGHRAADFGLDDIAFIDGGGAVLFYTTTHEGCAYIAPKLAKKLNDAENTVKS